jgi:hypothetical protein
MEAVKFTAERWSGRGPLGSSYVSYVFVFLGSIIISRLYKLTISDEAQVTLQLTVSLSELAYSLAGPIVQKGSEK